jgi:hypothetical protein
MAQASPLELLARVRLFAVADAAEAQLLQTAFYRYVELHGRIVSDPDSGCAFSSATGADAARIRLAAFWTAGAAREFDGFWAKYQRVYGPNPAYALSPAG